MVKSRLLSAANRLFRPKAETPQSGKPRQLESAGFGGRAADRKSAETAESAEISETAESAEISSTDQQAAPLAVDVRGVRFTYPGGDRQVLDGASLQLKAGSFTAVIGGNGSGKSTLCKLFNGLIPHYYSGDFEGEVWIEGRNAAVRSVAELSRQVGYVYQDFDNQLVRPTVLDEACFAPLNYGLKEYRSMGRQALEQCGLLHLQDRFIWELSGGQRHLLAIAGALSMQPAILVVDEPVSQLDPSHARQVYELLSRLHREQGITIVVIEHHAEFIADYCTEACLMDAGKMRWLLPVPQALNRLDELAALGIQPPEVTQAAARLNERLTESGSGLMAGVPDENDGNQATRLPITLEEAERCLSSLLAAAAAAPASAGLAPANPATTWQAFADSRPLNEGLVKADRTGSARSAPDLPTSTNPVEHLQSPDNTPPGPALLELSKISLSYGTQRNGRRTILDGISLSLHAGERVAVVGGNGAGKSSLLKAAAGIVRPDAGELFLQNGSASGVPLEQMSEQVGYVFQNPEDMFIDDCVSKEVSYALTRRKVPDAELRLHEMLQAFRLQELAERDARLLSGGQQRRCSLAIGAAMRPAVMLLDEPTANLDMATREDLLRTLQALSSHVSAVVVATHDMGLVREWASRVIVLNGGRIAADGPPEKVFADRELMARAGLTLTGLMELTDRLGFGERLARPTPVSLAAEMMRLINSGLTREKEEPRHADCPQMA
ncbi:energy-coupling factor ABC transporter ATP-binding protein [Paenibacillus pasadenensis]|uniref:ABC transporter ATP-binding protein n=1 Tax=Paenibacillus pasadenensis TaxID=217090 RepID=UPI00203BDBD5|nr:ABC transporter ATP-binding protein [Paenibacillus pasadenensis]MCM3747616.1 energy-coupling factor ABC transporter ATP-binding protein [Paenibacillus pasadenensis]